MPWDGKDDLEMTFPVMVRDGTVGFETRKAAMSGTRRTRSLQSPPSPPAQPEPTSTSSAKIASYNSPTPTTPRRGKITRSPSRSFGCSARGRRVFDPDERSTVGDATPMAARAPSTKT
ncbi:hypothetical protein CONLIGDRAFT_649966 [Coniochaeta ligniaria NRRL 30616]|uniref:Uncharacterized protein n=1 Tax=Coniochaeta ligniaria NRRL 30616 TaxID=1408157 RepID=A0A1J7J6N7_9PEZI|nr:hypothetical protein CONLIGDRAFT_649966 [Coniochaeta ligniaria NRRL 30616]